MKLFILSIITAIVFFFAIILITWKPKHYHATIIIENMNYNKDTLDIKYKGSLHIIQLYNHRHLIDAMDSIILYDVNHYRILNRKQITDSTE